MKSLKASVALISLLLISAFTLVLVVGASVASLSNYESAYQYEASHLSYFYAEACLEEGLLRLEADNTFPGTTLNFDADSSCIVTVTAGSPVLFSIEVSTYGHTEQYSAEVELTSAGQIYNSELLTWEEV